MQTVSNLVGGIVRENWASRSEEPFALMQRPAWHQYSTMRRNLNNANWQGHVLESTEGLRIYHGERANVTNRSAFATAILFPSLTVYKGRSTCARGFCRVHVG